MSASASRYCLLLLSHVHGIVACDRVAEADFNSITDVHLVASNHLDVGYTKPIPRVLDDYWYDHYPKLTSIIDYIQQESAKSGFSDPNFKFLTHSWLIDLYYDCPPFLGVRCPSKAELDYLTALIENQQLYWHAFPFNSQLELYDNFTFDFGLQLSQRLERHFENAYHSLVLSQKDIPGMTRSVIPILKKNGILAISVGVNAWSRCPNVPNVFKWYDPESGQEILALYGMGYASGGVLTIRGFKSALVLLWNSDNGGPHLKEYYVKKYREYKYKFQNAKVYFSTLTDFVKELLQDHNTYGNLTRIDSEIGDTWNHGPSSDPFKLAAARIMQNERFKYLMKGHSESYGFRNFSRFLLKCGEHTFGPDMIKPDHFEGMSDLNTIWREHELNKVVNTEKSFQRFVDALVVQRRFCVDFALDALKESQYPPDKELLQQISEQIDSINVNHVDWNKMISSDFVQLDVPADLMYVFQVLLDSNVYSIQFDPLTGSIVKLSNVASGEEHIIQDANTANHNINGLGVFLYQSRTEADFHDFWRNYTDTEIECASHFCKPGVEEATHSQHLNVKAKMAKLLRHRTNQNEFLVVLQLDNYLHSEYGAPQTIYNHITFRSLSDHPKLDGDAIEIEMDVLWFNKSSTRIPESLWFAFNTNKCDAVLVNKLAENVDVNDVVDGGNKHLHLVDVTGDGVECRYESKAMFVNSLHAGLVGVMPNGYEWFTPFPTPTNVSSNINGGIGFVLFDNTWNTNYPLWYPFDKKDSNHRFQFTVRFGTTKTNMENTHAKDFVIGIVILTMAALLWQFVVRRHSVKVFPSTSTSGKSN